MRIVTMVNWNVGVRYLKELIRMKEDIVGVVVWPEDPPSGYPLDGYSVRKVAFENYLPVYQPMPKEINTPKFIKLLANLKPDLIISSGFPKIFCKEILQIPSLGCINTHPSLLPKYRGMAPDFWAIINGDKETGLTVHFLDEGVDSGDIISQGKVEISSTDTGFTLEEKLGELASELFKKWFPLVKEGNVPRIKQNNEGATFCNWRKIYAQINWNDSAIKIYNLTRALTSPSWGGGAFTFLNKKKIKVWKAEIIEGDKKVHFVDNKIPGQILAITGRGFVVNTGKGQLLLTEIEFEEDKNEEVVNYLRGIAIPMVLG